MIDCAILFYERKNLMSIQPPKYFPERLRVRGQVARAIKKGILIRPKKCSRCNEDNKTIRAHHPNYSNPLNIIWLCKSCHQREHGKLKRKLSPSISNREKISIRIKKQDRLYSYLDSETPQTFQSRIIPVP